jgi:hypothetical protein
METFPIFSAGKFFIILTRRRRISRCFATGGDAA